MAVPVLPEAAAARAVAEVVEEQPRREVGLVPVPALPWVVAVVVVAIPRLSAVPLFLFKQQAAVVVVQAATRVLKMVVLAVRAEEQMELREEMAAPPEAEEERKQRVAQEELQALEGPAQVERQTKVVTAAITAVAAAVAANMAAAEEEEMMMVEPLAVVVQVLEIH